MTTSYELSLRLKELGAVQEDREYYWYDVDGTPCVLHKASLVTMNLTVLCAALTLGELVREMVDTGILETYSYTGKSGLVTYVKMSSGIVSAKESTITPEEAAGELYCELLKQK